MEAMEPIAHMLDSCHRSDRFKASLDAMRSRLDDPQTTPSARILRELEESKTTYFQWALGKSRAHKEAILGKAIDGSILDGYRAMAEASWRDQHELEASDSGSFDDYIAAYFAQHQQ